MVPLAKIKVFIRKWGNQRYTFALEKINILFTGRTMDNMKYGSEKPYKF
jgi:hypothetical protein